MSTAGKTEEVISSHQCGSVKGSAELGTHGLKSYEKPFHSVNPARTTKNTVYVVFHTTVTFGLSAICRLHIVTINHKPLQICHHWQK